MKGETPNINSPVLSCPVSKTKVIVGSHTDGGQGK